MTAALWERVRRAPAWQQDTALALLLTAYTQWELSVAEIVEGPLWAQRLTFALMTGALALRRVAPLPAAVLGGAGLALQTPLGAAEVVGGFLAVIALTHSVALRCDRRDAVLGLVCILFGVHLYDVLYPEKFSLADLIGNATIFLLVWALARGARRWRERTDELRARATALEQQREAQVRVEIGAERARIGRELHDIVAHGISVMVLQAGAARQVLASSPESACTPLLAVESSGRQALGEMQRLLGVLRRDDDGLAPGPLGGLAQLDDLVGQLGAAGLDIDLTIEGDRRELPPSLELSAYRIVQEALTNTLKHGRSGQAQVTVRYDVDAVEVWIRDAGGADAAGDGAGFGLVGMRERVALFGGELSAGPGDDGGWTVRARLPVESVAL